MHKLSKVTYKHLVFNHYLPLGKKDGPSFDLTEVPPCAILVEIDPVVLYRKVSIDIPSLFLLLSSFKERHGPLHEQN